MDGLWRGYHRCCRSVDSTACGPRAARPMAGRVNPIHMLQIGRRERRILSDFTRNSAKSISKRCRRSPFARPARFRAHWPFDRRFHLKKSRAITEIRKRFIDARPCRLARCRPEAHEHAGRCNEPHRCASPTPARAARVPSAYQTEARMAIMRTPAIKQIASGRFGVTAALPDELSRKSCRSRSPKEPSRARAGSLPGLQGHGGDRASLRHCDTGGLADFTTAASRYLFHRGSRAAYLRPEADQSDGQSFPSSWWRSSGIGTIAAGVSLKRWRT